MVDFFGVKDGFLDMDVFRLVSWAWAITAFGNKLVNVETDKLDNYFMYEELVQLCQVIYKRFTIKKQFKS